MLRERVVRLGISLILLCVLAVPVSASTLLFTCHDHPNGGAQPPTYGLRIDDLIDGGIYTFSFDYVDMTGTANVLLEWDQLAGAIRIYGRAYGGLDVGGAWDATQQGWVDLDFLYTDFVNQNVDNCAGAAGNDVYVTAESNNNGGTVTLDGWGGNQVFQLYGKQKVGDCAFIFDDDYDSKGNPAISADPTIWHGTGWLQPMINGARDWLFIAEMMTVPTEDKTWGAVKALYGE